MEANSTYSIKPPGRDVFQVAMKMHAENRLKLIARMTNSKAPANSVILLDGGCSTTRHSTDHEPLFRQESFFQYLFGVKEPDCKGLIDITTKKAILLIPKLPAEYAWWMGKIQPPSYFQSLYEVDSCRYVDELDDILSNELKVSVIYTLHGLNTDSKEHHQPATFKGIEKYTVDKEKLFPEIVECRVIKSEEELKLLRYINKCSSDAHAAVMKMAKPGVLEYQCEAKFLYEAYYNGGCRNVSYTCICAAGSNGSVLHYGHAGAPNNKQLKDGQMVVFDMGAEHHCYASDITRSFPVNGKFTQDQRDVYETVLAAQEAVMKSMKPGVEWTDMHRLANRVICEEFKRRGFLQGDVDDMLKNHVGAVFMPHGLGHLLGLDTHDVGGYPKGVERINEPGLKSLRCRRPLEAGMVITVEPGVYFIESLLEAAFKNPSQAKFLNVEKIKTFMSFGGVRIEDDVIVTNTGIENMTTVPRSVEEIEKLMRG